MATSGCSSPSLHATCDGQRKRLYPASGSVWRRCHVQDLSGCIFNYSVLLITPFDFPSESPFCSFCDSLRSQVRHFPCQCQGKPSSEPCIFSGSAPRELGWWGKDAGPVWLNPLVHTMGFLGRGKDKDQVWDVH